jgi:hypothetical protein
MGIYDGMIHLPTVCGDAIQVDSKYWKAFD